MSNTNNQDLYEVLEVSPNASQETIERMFRYFAQRYHPDRQGSGNADRFQEIVRAHDTLKEPESRAAYDACRKTNMDYQWSVVEEAGDRDTFEKDNLIQERVLSLLYTKRKRDPVEPGLGSTHLEHMTGCPTEILDFHLWYLKEKGWIARTENGLVAITADGVDQSLQSNQPAGERMLVSRL